MGWIVTRLGYGAFGLIDADDPNNPPKVSVSGTISGTFNAQLQQNFGRILNEQFNDNEEVRFLKPMSYANSFEYCGVALAGSLTSDPVWTCLRCSYDNNGRKNRYQIRTGVIWDNVTQGWN